MLKKPIEWSKEKGIEIVNPGGWNHGYNKDFDIPISEEEFDLRSARSDTIYNPTLLQYSKESIRKYTDAIIARIANSNGCDDARNGIVEELKDMLNDQNRFWKEALRKEFDQLVDGKMKGW